jgi:hypothetical protein
MSLVSLDPADPDAVVQAIGRFPKTFVYNESRRALQILTCGGAVRQSSPLGQDVIDALAAAASSTTG